jgi:HEAT repeat protein
MEYLEGQLNEDWMQLALKKLPRHELKRLLQRHFSVTAGRARERLVELYLRLGFDQMDVKATYSWAWWKRASGVRGLGELENDAYRSVFLRCLRDKHELVAIEAAKALGILGDARGLDALADMVRHPSRWAALLLSDVAQRIGEEGLVLLRRLITDDPRPAVRATALDAVRIARDSGSIDRIRPLLAAPDKELRTRTIKALSEMGAVDAVPDILKLLGDDAWEVRAQAVKAVGRLGGDEQVFRALRWALSDPSWWVRVNAAQALASLGEKGQAVLSEVSRTSPDAFARDIAQQVMRSGGSGLTTTVMDRRG